MLWLLTIMQFHAMRMDLADTYHNEPEIGLTTCVYAESRPDRGKIPLLARSVTVTGDCPDVVYFDPLTGDMTE